MRRCRFEPMFRIPAASVLARAVLAVAVLTVWGFSAAAASGQGAQEGAGRALSAGARASHSEAPVSGSWLSYGHDLANTRFNDDGGRINSRTVRRLTDKWSKSGIEGVVGTPTVSGPDAYFADLTGTVWAVRLSSGRVIWRTRIGPGAVAATAVHGAFLYAASGGTLYGIERSSGRIRWQATT